MSSHLTLQQIADGLPDGYEITDLSHYGPATVGRRLTEILGPIVVTGRLTEYPAANPPYWSFRPDGRQRYECVSPVVAALRDRVRIEEDV